MSFPRYEAYKNSGIEWLGEVPADWQVIALKRLVSLRSGEAITSELIEDEGTYSVFGGNGHRGYSEHYTHEGNYVLIGRQGALCGNINYASCRFWASEHALVATPLRRVEVGWLGELLRAMNLNQYSISAAQPGLSAEALGRLPIPVPPDNEQSCIAHFLRREAAKIDALIAEQERLIALLKEKRQAVITHAVTKGLDPDTPVKDSGVEWLGKVPAHWTVEKFSRQVFIAEGQVDPREEPYASMLLIAPNHIESGTGRLVSQETAAEQGADSGKYQFEGGAVIYSKIRPHLAKATIAPTAGLCSADMYPLTSKGMLDQAYLLLVLLTAGFTAWAVLESDRVAMPKINREKLNELRLPVPPLQEQKWIVQHVRREVGVIEELVAEAERATTLLQERRSALISAAVTGKIDVRGFAPASAEAA